MLVAPLDISIHSSASATAEKISGAEQSPKVHKETALPSHTEEVLVLWMDRYLMIGVLNVCFSDQRSPPMVEDGHCNVPL